MILGSKRSAHSNAYFYGFFNNKRIVLYDTLLKDSKVTNDNKIEEKDENTDIDQIKEKGKGMNDDEILAILGHELGHWKLNHVLFYIIISQVKFIIFILIIIVFLFLFLYFYLGQFICHVICFWVVV